MKTFVDEDANIKIVEDTLENEFNDNLTYVYKLYSPVKINIYLFGELVKFSEKRKAQV